MRVIAGQFRHRQLTAPAGWTTRPSSDRLRETLFNILGGSVRDSVFIDAYAGSGAVGIEAVSRGAAQAIWIESQPAALRALRANLATLSIAAGVVVPLPAMRALPRLEREPSVVDRGGCDFFFLDPPYAQAAAALRLIEALASRPRLIAARTQVVVESQRGEPWPERCGRLWRARVHPQGDSQLTFFRATE